MTKRPPGARSTADQPAFGRTWVMVSSIAGLVAVLIALHGHLLRLPFISDDYFFLADTSRGNWRDLFGAFHTAQNYFRPLGREMYFLVLSRVFGSDPIPFRLFNLVTLVAIVSLVAVVTRQVAGVRAGILAAATYTLLHSHQVCLAWISCSQDLLATTFALLGATAFLHGRAMLAGGALLLGLFAKESVITLPLVLGIWTVSQANRAGAHPPLWRHALRKTMPLWSAAAIWSLVVIGVRTWRGAWSHGEVPLADVTLGFSDFWEGYRSAQLAHFNAEQPWAYLFNAAQGLRFPWLGAALISAVAALAYLIRHPSTPVGPGTLTGRRGGLWLAAIWTVISALPIGLVGHHFSAYYVTFSAVGFAMMVGIGLARTSLPATLCALVLLTTLNASANRVTNFRFRDNRDDLIGVSFVNTARLVLQARFLDSLRTAMERHPPPRGAIVYLSHAPSGSALVTADGRAPRIWFGDPQLELSFVGQYVPGRSDRPKRFLRFNAATRGFDALPEPLVEAIVDGEECLARGDWTLARSSLLRALGVARAGTHDLERIELTNSLGVASSQMGDTARARLAWQATLDLSPSHSGALLNLAALEAGQSHFEPAMELVRRLLEADPNHPLGLLYLSRLEAELNNPVGAQEVWARLARTSPHFADSVTRAARSR